MLVRPDDVLPPTRFRSSHAKQAAYEPRPVPCRVPCGVPHGILREGPKDAVDRKQGVLLAPRHRAGGRAVEETAARSTSAETSARSTSATPGRTLGASGATGRC